MMTSHEVDLKQLAADLLAQDPAVNYEYPHPERASVTLPDGRVCTLQVEFDSHAGIGRWLDQNGNDTDHHDDVFGIFQWRGTDRDTGLPGERPSDFDGRARVLAGYGTDRIDGEVWWQPPADVADEHLEQLFKQVKAWISGEWFHVGLIVECNGESASLWGIEWGHLPGCDSSDYIAETLIDLLFEAGAARPSTHGVAPWARDMLEAIARRRCDHDEDSPEYDAELSKVLTWWRDVVEPAGDWDMFGGPFTDVLESALAQWEAQS